MTITITHRRIKIMTRVTSSRATSNPRLRPFQLMKNLTCHLSCLEGPKRRPSLLLRIRMIARVITIMDRPTLRTTLMLIMEAINSLRASLTTMVMAMEAAKLTPSTIKTQAKIKTTARISSRILISTSRTTCRHLLTTNRKLTIMLQQVAINSRNPHLFNRARLWPRKMKSSACPHFTEAATSP